MSIFHFSQFEHEPFSQYSSRLNDYRAQYVHFTYEKWKIYEVVLEGITRETQAILESTSGGFCALNADAHVIAFSLWLGINGNLKMLVSLLCSLPPIRVICTLSLHVLINSGIVIIIILIMLILYALVANLLIMMWNLVLFM